MPSPGGSGRSQDDGQDPLGQLLAESLFLGFRAVCLSLDAFLHDGFGTTYLRGGPAAVPLGLWFLGQFPTDDPRPIGLFLIAYAVLWANAAVQAVRRWWRGEPRQHSLYTGRPFVLDLAPTWGERAVKVLEPAVVAAVGWSARGLNRPLGDWLALAGALAFARASLGEADQRNRAAHLYDMAVEELAVAERFRDMQHPRR